MTAILNPVADSPHAFKESWGVNSTLPIKTHHGADISYFPDEVKWRARTARRLAEDPTLPDTPLPEGWPTELKSTLVWDGKDWTDEKQWVYELTEEQLQEIKDALKHFQSLSKPMGFISQETFPLPTLGPILKDLAVELHTGRGFFVLRTIPVDEYTRLENIIIYAGVSSYIAPLRGVQHNADEMIYHIKDLSATVPLSVTGAPAYTTDRQVFHTDVGDVIALFALEVAAEGGISRIASTWKIYNEFAKTRPDLIKTLSEPNWAFDTFGGTPKYAIRPLMFHIDNKIMIQCARRLLTGFPGLQRSPDTPPITEAQAEALDALHFLGEKHSLGLNFQKGDIQFINNLSIFHARDAFRDEGKKTRHLIRLWLRNEELAWPTPEPLKPRWKYLYYNTPLEKQTFMLEPATNIDSDARAGLRKWLEKAERKSD